VRRSGSRWVKRARRHADEDIEVAPEVEQQDDAWIGRGAVPRLQFDTPGAPPIGGQATCVDGHVIGECPPETDDEKPRIDMTLARVSIWRDVTRVALVAVALVVVLVVAASSASARVAVVSAPSTKQKVAYPNTVGMYNVKVAHWAPVVSDVDARVAPNRLAKVITQVTTVTGDGTQNILLVLKQLNVTPTQAWYQVRLAILPNGSLGWVPRSALGNVYAVDTHLYINRKTFTATLDRDGIPVWSTRVGVGEPYWPTPAGQFYVRDRLTGFTDPAYGPLAFGTNGRSAVLTEWPGGGFIGIHGTDVPELIPGAISHGCVRMKNSAILQLGKLMHVGTPVTIT
jgi:lipoprotein-anchoring transpeptidase ErfK/SrfK